MGENEEAIRISRPGDVQGDDYRPVRRGLCLQHGRRIHRPNDLRDLWKQKTEIFAFIVRLLLACHLPGDCIMGMSGCLDVWCLVPMILDKVCQCRMPHVNLTFN